ncbi:hypothetical protein HYU22_04295 [Candidatus Woesearchaeota archaeon]|nr:hypothetical protein [Candidatus Woesearchaeota archaeon]
MNGPKPVKKEGAIPFVQSMLQSAADRTETKAQTRYDMVDPQELGRTMENLQKGIISPRKRR